MCSENRIKLNQEKKQFGKSFENSKADELRWSVEDINRELEIISSILGYVVRWVIKVLVAQKYGL